MKFNTSVVASALLITVLVASAVFSQPSGTYGDYFRTPEYLSGQQAIQDGDLEKALQIFRKISQENPRTTVGAVATGQVAQWTESAAEKQAMLEKMAKEYIGSRFEIKGRLALLGRQGLNEDNYLTAVDRLAQSYGGPSLREIFTQKHGKLVGKVERLPYEIQVGLSLAYNIQHQEYSFRGLGRANCFRLAHFSREAFPFMGITNENLGNIETDYMLTRFGKRISPRNYQDPWISPTIRLLAPRNSIKGPRPKIQFTVTVAPWPSGSIDLKQMVCTLDGEDIRKQLDVKSDLDEKARGDRPLEILTFTYSPASNLSPGQHLLRIQASLSGWTKVEPTGMSSLDVPFRVAKQHNDDEDRDERRDDDD